MAVVNFPPRQIGPFMSEVLTLGVMDEAGRDLLSDERHAQPGLAGDLAAVDAQLAGEELEQGRLAAAVATEGAEAVV